MTNENIRENLKAYLDGELSPEQSQLVKEAIENDSSLQNEAEFMSLISKSLKQFASVPAPKGEKVEQFASRFAKRKWWLSPLGLTTSVAAIAFLVVLILPITRSGIGNRIRYSETAAPAGEKSAAGRDSSVAMAPAAPMESEEPPKMEAKDEGLAAGSALPSPDVADIARQVIRRASLSIRVVNAEETEKKVNSMVTGWGGFVQDTQSYNLDSKTPQVVLTLRVPAKHFDHAIEEFEGLGVRTEKTISGEDVTAQIADMDARLKNLKAQELTYRQILGQAKKVGEVLEVQQYLTDIRGQIESLEAQLKSTRNLASLSTITLTLQQRPSENESPKDKGWADDAWSSAANGLRSAMQALGKALITTFVYAPIWLPVAVLLWLLSRRFKVQK